MRKQQITLTWYDPQEELPVKRDSQMVKSQQVFMKLRENASQYKQEIIAEMYYDYRSKQWLNCCNDLPPSSPEYYKWELIEWCYLPFELR